MDVPKLRNTLQRNRPELHKYCRHGRKGAELPLKMATSAPSMRKTGGKWWQMAWIKCDLSLLQLSIPGSCADQGDQQSLQLCGTQSTAHAREKSSSCCLQTRIPNPGVISDSYKNKWNVETNREWNSFLICPSSLLFLKQDEAGTEMGSTVLKWHLQHPRGPFRATKNPGDVLKACRWFLQGE